MTTDGARNNGRKTRGAPPPVEHQFKPGNPGRPKGSRNKLGEAFISALHDDFVEHGVATIQEVRAKDPVAYVKVCASILPKELKIERMDDLTDDQLDKRIRQLAAALSLELGGEEGANGASSGAQAPVRPH